MRLREEAFSCVPRLRAGLFCDLPPGEFCQRPIPPFGMAAVSPRDKSRKDGALSPVTSEKASSLSPHRWGPPDATRSAGGASLIQSSPLWWHQGHSAGAIHSGVLECWSVGKSQSPVLTLNWAFHYSISPSLHYSRKLRHQVKIQMAL
jgi:hypothetical protein